MKQVLKEFMDLGFTQEEVFKIFEVRKKVQAFKKTDIHNRFKSLCLFFKKFRKTPSEVRKKILQSPKLFDYSPEFIETNFKKIASIFNRQEKEVFSHFWDTPLLFSISANTMERTIKAQADVLNVPFEIWREIVLKKPPVLKKSANMIKSSVHLIASEFSISTEEWIKISLKASELLCADPNTLIKKTKEHAKILGTNVQGIVKSFSSFPSLFYLDPQKLQAKYDFMKQMYFDDLISLDDGGEKKETALQQYLLKKALILVYSLEALELKRVYAQFIKNKKGKAQKAPLYRTEINIIKELETAPTSFWTPTRYAIFQKRLSQRRKEQHERSE